MESHEAQLGVLVRVREGHRKSQYAGMLGTIRHRYGSPDYPALDVLLMNGRFELFWSHQLDKADAEVIGA